jgi:hypothetical protein
VAAYQPADAITHVKALIKSMAIDTADSGNLKYRLVDFVSSLVWTAAPWSWTLGEITAVTLVASTQDYTITDPADFLYLHMPEILDGDQINELKTVAFLPTNTSQTGNPSRIAHLTNKVRLFPTPRTNYAGKTLLLPYKKVPPKVTVSNYSTAGALVLPDAYFPVIEAGVQWLAYQYADDQRAGTATVDQDGKTQWTQQAGIFFGLINEMKRGEKLNLQYPGESITHG